MSEIFKEISTIWNRLFDHKQFLCGEIQFTLREFELKRKEVEVDQLLFLLEKLTDIRDVQHKRLQDSIESGLNNTQENLSEIHNICDSLANLEEKYQKDTTVDLRKKERKLEWEAFIDIMANSCTEIDNTYKEKEDKLQKLIKCIKSLDACSDMPPVFVGLRKRRPEITKLNHTDPLDCNLLTHSDRDFLENLDLNPATLKTAPEKCEMEDGNLLNVKDLLWLSNKLQKDKNSSEEKLYLHDLLMGSDIILPQNEEIPRNQVLEKRCQLLKRQQENRAYKAMTKDVDTVRKQLPEDTIAYQIKHLNRQLIAVGQFIISVFAGFMFGFQGIELMIGPFDFGFRLLLGVIFSLTIALAELYFLAKKLNEDLNYKHFIEEKQFHSKMD